MVSVLASGFEFLLRVFCCVHVPSNHRTSLHPGVEMANLVSHPEGSRHTQSLNATETENTRRLDG